MPTARILNFHMNYSFFTSGNITIISQGGSYINGIYTDGASIQEVVATKKVMVPIAPKQITALGIGEFSYGEVYSLFVPKALKFSNGTLLDKGDSIEFKTKRYKVMSCLDFESHGFYKYILTLQREGKVND